MGSAGAKVISVVRDVSDAYVHAGGQYEWDSAAPVAVARAAGLHTSRHRRLARWSTTRRTSCCPTWSCAVPSWPTRSSTYVRRVASEHRGRVNATGRVLWDADGVLQHRPDGWEASMRPAVGHLVDDVEGFLAEAFGRSGPALRVEVRWLEVLPVLLERWGIADALRRRDAGLADASSRSWRRRRLVRRSLRAQRRALLPRHQPGRAPGPAHARELGLRRPLRRRLLLLRARRRQAGPGLLRASVARPALDCQRTRCCSSTTTEPTSRRHDRSGLRAESSRTVEEARPRCASTWPGTACRSAATPREGPVSRGPPARRAPPSRAGG